MSHQELLMANVDVAPAPSSSLDTAARATAPLLVSLASTSPDQLASLLERLADVLAGLPAVVLSPDVDTPESRLGGLTVLPLEDDQRTRSSWVLSGPDFVAAHRQAVAHGASGVLVLGPEAHSLESLALRSLIDAVYTGTADLATPNYALQPREALVNAAILYPVTRALYGASARFPAGA